MKGRITEIEMKTTGSGRKYIALKIETKYLALFKSYYFPKSEDRVLTKCALGDAIERVLDEFNVDSFFLLMMREVEIEHAKDEEFNIHPIRKEIKYEENYCCRPRRNCCQLRCQTSLCQGCQR